MPLSTFTREKRVMVGHAYMEADIFTRDANQERAAKRGTRKRKHKVSAPAQVNLNHKNARRYLEQLANGNFEDGDLFLTLTYKPEFAPKTIEEAEKYVRNYLRRLARRMKKDHLEPLKYILVTEARVDEDNQVIGHVHHHLLINGELDRDLVEKMWTTNRKLLGDANTRRLDQRKDLTGNHFQGIADYMSKDPQGKKRWSSSRNLKRPVATHNDWKYRRRKIEALAQDPAKAYTYFSDKYPDWDIVAPIESQLNPITGEWSIYLKMWRKSEREAG